MSNIIVHKIVNDILQSCTYIISVKDSNQAFVVDCGDIEPLRSYFRRESKTVIGVILTHAHFDHVYGLKELLADYPIMKVYAGEKTIKGLADPDINMSYLYDEDFILELKPEQYYILQNGDCFDVLGVNSKAIATPGHDIDCTTFIVGDTIFTGDSYNPASPVFCKWSRSDETKAKENEAFIKELIEKNKYQVYPGHLID